MYVLYECASDVTYLNELNKEFKEFQFENVKCQFKFL